MWLATVKQRRNITKNAATAQISRERNSIR